MDNFKNLLKNIIDLLSSARLALVLVLLVILISLAGALLPQYGSFETGEIKNWQSSHPVITSLMEPLGMFRAFHSEIFLIVIILLGINTLTCTMKHFFLRGGVQCLVGPEKLKNTGFILLHLSLIGILIGGAISSGFTLDGLMVLTEGQTLKEGPQSYIRKVEGPLRKQAHAGFFMKLNRVKIKEQNRIITEMVAEIKLGHREESKISRVSINNPVEFMGHDITLHQTGYSPRVMVKERSTQKIILHSYIALKTFFIDRDTREYRDFIPFPRFIQQKERVILTYVKGEAGKGSLKVEIRNPEGGLKAEKLISNNSEAEVGNFIFAFTGLRQWASFMVMDDPGFFWVGIFVWIGLLGLLLRYLKEITSWQS